MSLSSFSVIKENHEHYQRCHEILGLPESVEWASLKVEFGTGDVGLVTLVLLPTGEQVRDLAELAIQQIQDSCSSDDAGYAHSDPLLDEARASVVLDGETRS